MEEQKPRIQSSLPFHHPLARQLYSDEYGSAPIEEDSNVVPMPIQNTITEDERLSYTASKRKQRSATEGKTRAATGSKKPFKTVRQSQSTPPYQYADELKRLEDHAKRLHQILADRASKDAIYEPSATLSTGIPPGSANSSPANLTTQPATQSAASTPLVERQVNQQLPPIQPIKNQWQSPTSIAEQEVESLTFQKGSIQQRLHELGLHLNEAGSLIASSEVPRASETANRLHGQSSILQPSVPISSPLSHSPTQAWNGSPRELRDGEPSQTPKTECAPTWNKSVAANQNLLRDRPRSHSSSPPITLRRYLRELRGRLRDGRSLELPRQPINRIGDAALWIATAAIVRVASRYVIAAFPLLSPIFLMLTLAPAISAVYLVFCAPKAGWLPYYRLFLMMIGFLVGGKL
ncbi:MAG: hypothetical protein DCF22_01720 [Leptolyngbya sp.]|nr:MAG: hypothetical protein DCF22_01720 [Leptolyngbya sp.]